ncbi:MAG: CcoQ/FixQ family Cbb3-type cytochrome c oxidase assembly chaperone [Flavobacteriales bacterium]|nr:CcoQ/FixQ family Cbb3-type cytochrome c oxidase assembly chaperone [Flavobacteriales bacterium]
MLKFIKHHMETIAGVDIYPIISFIIFFTFFLVVTAYVIKQSKAYFDEVSLLPLEDNQGSTNKN